MGTMKSLQELYAPAGICFGCGQANDKGLRLRSFVEGEELVARWTPQPHHAAFHGVLNGGICGALMDCHSNWAAMWGFKQDRGVERIPVAVTASFHVQLKRPTPTDRELLIRARAIEIDGDRAKVEASIELDGKFTATCSGLFIAVAHDHPAAVSFHAE